MAGLLGGGLLCGQVRSTGADVGPVELLGKSLASDVAVGFALDRDGKLGRARLVSIHDIREMPDGRSTATSELTAFGWRQRHKVFFEVHASLHHMVQFSVNTKWCHS